MTKEELRTYYRLKRSRLSDETIRSGSLGIATSLLRWLSGHPVAVIHSFLPAPEKKEVDTFLILKALTDNFPGITCVAPRMTGQKRQLAHYRYTPGAPLRHNRQGIPEPAPSIPFSPSQIDLVLVPLLAFDQTGHRVGYGGGFYDIFLAECRSDTIKAGLSLFPPVSAIADTGPWDIRLDYCFMPDAVWQRS